MEDALPVDADRAAKEHFLVASGFGFAPSDVAVLTDVELDAYVARVQSALDPAVARAQLAELMARFQALIARVDAGEEDARVVVRVLSRVDAMLARARADGFLRRL